MLPMSIILYFIAIKMCRKATNVCSLDTRVYPKASCMRRAWHCNDTGVQCTLDEERVRYRLIVTNGVHDRLCRKKVVVITS